MVTTKQTQPSVIVRIVAAFLDVDPEAADMYLYRFYRAHGIEDFRELLKWVHDKTIVGAEPVGVYSILEHDLADGEKELLFQKEAM